MFRIVQIFLIIASLNLIGCSSFQSVPSRASQEAKIHDLLKKADIKDGQERYLLQIEAAKISLEERQEKTTRKILSQITTNTNEKLIISAKLELQKHKNYKADLLLNKISNPYKMPESQLIEYLKTKAKIRQNRHQVHAFINTLSELYKLSTSREKAEINRLIWNQLLQTPLSKIRIPMSQNNLFSTGWIKLAILVKEAKSETEFLQKIAYWKTEFPNHPAIFLISGSAPNAKTNKYKKISLLLPLQGELRSAGRAIRNGFISAYYSNFNRGGKAPQIKIIDTNSKPIAELYKQAVANNSDLIIGPLRKSKIKELIDNVSITVPTIALNTIDYSSPSQLYQFGLQPDEQFQYAAKQAALSGHKRALVIYPDNPWGQQIFKKFSNTWGASGGVISDTLTYLQTDPNKLAKEIKSLLGVKQSQSRAIKLERRLGETFRFIPQRRQDIDVIFLAAPAKQAKQIRPLLNFYYANNIPVYSPGNIINSKLERPGNLNDTNYCSTPWAIAPKDVLSNNLFKIYKNNKNSSNLYALGVDAYNLSQNLPLLLNLKELQIPSATGLIKLDNKVILAQPVCAKIINGKPNLLPIESTVFN